MDNNKKSQLFKSSWNTKGTETTGFFANGSMEAWKLPILLMQLIFCINRVVQSNVRFKKDTNSINKMLTSFEEVIKIAEDCSINEFKIEWNLLKENKVICKLPKAITCSEFTIHCNSHNSISDDSNRVINVCDFVEIKYVINENESSTEIARLICIFRFYTFACLSL